MNYLHFSLLLLLPLSLNAAQPATNGTAPFTVEADQMELDQTKGTSTYSGNVTLIQGGLELRAERITLYTVNRQLQRVVSEGKPTSMERQQGGQEPPLRARAEWIEYQPQQQLVQLRGKALLWHDGNEFSGEQISYDLEQKLVRASGDKQGDSRVRVLLQPANEVPSTEKRP